MTTKAKRPTKPRRHPTYAPQVCHRCTGGGCERCGNGFTRGPKSTPVLAHELSVSQLNLRDARRRAVAA